VVPEETEQSYARTGLRHFASISAVALAIATTATLAFAHGEEASPATAGPQPAPAPAAAPTPADADRGTTTAVPAEADKDKEQEKPKVPWRGSILLFDQSVTTQTVGLGKDYQSPDNTYEWWFAFKPRYVLFESKKASFSVGLWTNLYLEMTNSDSTVTSQEPVIGATSLSAPFSYALIDSGGYKTSFNIGPRITFPTDKASRNSGMYLGLGASSGLSQSIPLAGKSAKAFNSMSLSASGMYSHSLNKATQAVNGNLDRTRQDALGRTFFSDQLGGGMNAQHRLNASFSAGLQITPKLGLGLSYVILNSWAYRPKDSTVCVVLTGCVEPQRVNDPQIFRVTPWALASLDYDATDELSVSLGYYNQTNQIGPDGLRRNPLWSPDAHIFFTLTGNLDAIYERFIAPPPPAPTQTASARR
jgi:hypothetical protein